MTISFERSGGFAARQLNYSVNSDELSEVDRNQLEQLVNASGFFDLPEQIKAPPGAADVFQFKITLQDDGREHTVEFDQTVSPAALKPLLQWLNAHARAA